MKIDKLYYFGVLLLAVLLGSCEKDNKLPVFSDDVVGTWVQQSYEDDVIIYQKANEFEEALPGIEFKNTGGFVQRANAGFCGTPPITYENYIGTWEKITENQYQIEVAYWAGVMAGMQEYVIEVVSINGNELKVKMNYEDN